MIYRGTAKGPGANAKPATGNYSLALQPDSAPVVHVDPSTRRLDTLVMIRIPKVEINVTQTADGRVSVQPKVHPMPTTDDWAFLSDGTVAVVRGHDFHVDWVDAERRMTSTPIIPFEWQRLQRPAHRCSRPSPSSALTSCLTTVPSSDPSRRSATPRGSSGSAPEGVVYLAFRDADGHSRLEMTRWR